MKLIVVIAGVAVLASVITVIIKKRYEKKQKQNKAS
jgi:hypothetical protein